MYLQSVNIGRPEAMQVGPREIVTGIRKVPATGGGMIGRLGVEGDAVMDGSVHGGPDQAVYVFGGADYDWWSAELSQPLAPGTFGDNLTIAGLESAGCAIGDRLAIGGTVVLEVSAPRIPCATLATRMGDPLFIKRFRDAERPGLYARVIVEGRVTVGDPVTLQPYAGERVTAAEVFRDNYDKERTAATLRRFLATPLAERVRTKKTRQLQELAAGQP